MSRPQSTGIPRVNFLTRKSFRVGHLFCLLSVLVLAACSSTASRHIEIKPGNIAVGLTPNQITWLLTQEGGGYERRDIHDRVAEQTGQVILTVPQTRLMFSAVDDPAYRVLVRVDNRSGDVQVDFFEEGTSQFSPEGLRRYQALRDRLITEFGPDQVSDKSGWFF